MDQILDYMTKRKFRLTRQVIVSDFVYENCALLDYCAASSGNSLPTFRDDLSVPSSLAEMVPLGSPETSVRNFHYSLRNSPEESSSHLLFDRSPKSLRLFVCL
jgi:hypothetical protein